MFCRSFALSEDPPQVIRNVQSDARAVPTPGRLRLGISFSSHGLSGPLWWNSFGALFKQSADHRPCIQAAVDLRDHSPIFYCFRQDLDEFAAVHRVEVIFQIHIHDKMIPAYKPDSCSPAKVSICSSSPSVCFVPLTVSILTILGNAHPSAFAPRSAVPFSRSSHMPSCLCFNLSPSVVFVDLSLAWFSLSRLPLDFQCASYKCANLLCLSVL